MWIGLITSGIGTLAFLIGARTMLRGQASKHWPTVPGKIVTSQMEEIRRNNGTTTYMVTIEYEYEDETGVARRGDRLTCGFHGAGSQGFAKRRVSQYPKDQKVQVSIDPKNPSYTVLEPGIAVTSWFVTGVGATFMIVGILFWAGLLQAGNAVQ